MTRVTWDWVQESKLPALVSMAKRAGLDDADGWHLTDSDVPMLIVTGGAKFCEWSNARECADYLQAWIDALSVVAMRRDS